jgi:hypothetical protein
MEFEAMTQPPPPPPNPDTLTTAEAKSGNELITLMGNVLACWQGIEHTIADIYLVFFRPMRADAASVALYAVRTFEARLSIVNALITCFCSDDHKATWADLYALARKRSSARNAIAHGLVMRHGRPPNSEFVVGQSIYDISNFPDPPLKNGFYTRKELREMCETFLSLTKKLDEFREALANDQALRAKLDAPSQQVLRHEGWYPLRMQMPGAPPPPPESSQE